MVRDKLTEAERERGERLGLLLRRARGERTMVEVALRANVSVETLRKIESGRVPTPAFFTVAALAGALDLSLDVLVDALRPPSSPAPSAGEPAASPAARPGPRVSPSAG